MFRRVLFRWSSPVFSASGFFFFFQAEDGIRDYKVTGVQTCALPISVVLSVAIGVSLFVSLTTTPMMCARFLRPETGRHNRLYRFSENAFNRVLRIYDVSLHWVLRHQFLILLLTLGTVCLNIYLFVRTPKGFFPQQDTGRITGLIQ